MRTRPGSPPNRQVIVATAGRVGSTWTCNLLSGVGFKPGHSLLPGEYLDKNSTLIIDKAVVALLEVEPFLTWYKSHSLPPPDYVPAEHPTVRFVTILRDPATCWSRPRIIWLGSMRRWAGRGRPSPLCRKPIASSS